MNAKVESSERWYVAYRKTGQDEFTLVDNPDWAWAADPFLVEYHNEILLFVELFLYKSERNGVLGYCKWDGEKFGEWKVTMDKHWHLSYPNVFVLGDSIYMVPESYQREDISLYVLEGFPDRWKRVRTLVDNTQSVDTTFLTVDGHSYMFTFEPSFRGFGGELFLYNINGKIDDDSIECRKIMKVSDDMKCSRPAGNLFYTEDGKLIRPAQDCSDGYGCRISFMEVEAIEPVYRERLFKTMSPKDIVICNKPNGLNFTGLHTYNRLSDMEVIDLKYSISDPEEQAARARVRQVFVEKYR